MVDVLLGVLAVGVDAIGVLRCCAWAAVAASSQVLTIKKEESRRI